MARFPVELEGCADAVACDSDEGVLSAMERAGAGQVKVGCRRGGCGICKVQVVRGEYRLGRMSRLQVTAEEQERGFALACRLYPESPLTIRVCDQSKGG